MEFRFMNLSPNNNQEKKREDIHWYYLSSSKNDRYSAWDSFREDVSSILDKFVPSVDEAQLSRFEEYIGKWASRSFNISMQLLSV